MGLTDYRLTPAGTGINGWNPGFMIRGIVINNLSGSWLNVKTSGLIRSMYVPPYTVGWSQAVTPGIQVVDITTTGPSGTIPSVAGDPWEAILSEDPVTTFSGFDFNSGRVSQPLIASGFVTPNTGTISIVPPPGAANKHVRTFFWTVGINAPLLIAANTPVEFSVQVVVFDGFGSTIPTNIDTLNQWAALPMTSGYDWHAATTPANGNIQLSVNYNWPLIAAFQDASIYYNMLYSIV